MLHKDPQTKAQPIATINSLGKEDLEEILHILIEQLQALAGWGHCRIYLEDLTRGALTCVAATGTETQAILSSSFPINDAELLVSQVYQKKKELAIDNLDNYPLDQPGSSAAQQAGASYLLPIIHKGRAIGVVCLDQSHPVLFPAQESLAAIRQLLSETAASLDQARKYTQELRLARQVDGSKKREAALSMVKSAVQLVDKVALASVLILVESDQEGEQTLQILASYSQVPEVSKLYEGEQQINLGPGESLVSRFIDRNGRIIDDRLLEPVYFPSLAAEQLQKRYITEELGLKSLYMVPRYHEGTRRIICLVNYYTRENYQFTPFERSLLESHAEMAQRVVQAIGDEHLEVQILSEIGDLLQHSSDGIRPFLHRVLSKATQLIGADTGSIAMVRETQGEHWLLVEDGNGRLVGAKHKDWMKKNIPPFRVGGRELPEAQRSLTGLAAITKQPQIIGDCQLPESKDNFYHPVTEAIRSEIAVPIIYDDNVVAVICLDSMRPHYFSDEHRRILLIIERMIGHHLSMLQKIEQLTSEIDRLRQDVDYRDPTITSYKLGNIIGNSAKTQGIIDTIQRISPPLCQRISQWSKKNLPDPGEILGLPSILITGETGAGKEFLFNNLFTRLNHDYRELHRELATLPLKKTNIAAYSGELTYSELFGHKRGAFTGAHSDRRGILEEANGGVVFLDEIGDADPKTQVQLLRFLDNGEFVRLGENITRHSQVLLVAGTNRNLRQLIEEGKFREDLYHRLSELIIEVPSLNERREDIPDLAVHFLGRLFQAYYPSEQEDNPSPQLSQEAKELLQQHHYSGNIRELRSILLRAMLFRSGPVIDDRGIRQALGSKNSDTATVLQMPVTKREEPGVQDLYQALLSGEKNFWDAVYAPYCQQELTRHTVLKLVDLARADGATNMPKLARHFSACDPAGPDTEEKKQFYRFKNFLYKTVKI